MRKFFETCLKNLSPLTGKKQFVYWEIRAGKGDQDAEREMNVCIAGMVRQSKNFKDIPEERQMAIIEKMMEEDLVYEELNSQTIYKWFIQERNRLNPVSQFSEDDLRPRDKDGNIVPPAPPEVAAKYLQEINANLAKIGNPLPTVAEIEQGLKEVKTKETGRQKFVMAEPCKVCGGTGLYSADPCRNCNGSGHINPVEIWATSQEEAQKAYDATFK